MSPIITMLLTTFVAGIAASFVLAQRRHARVGWQTELNGIRQDVLVAPGFNDLRSVEAAGKIEPLRAAGVWTDLAAATRKQAAGLAGRAAGGPDRIDPTPPAAEPAAPTDGPVAPAPRRDDAFDVGALIVDGRDPAAPTGDGLLDGLQLEPVAHIPFEVAVEPATRPDLVQELETTFGPPTAAGTVTERPARPYVDPPFEPADFSLAGYGAALTPVDEPESTLADAPWDAAPAAEPAAETLLAEPEPILEPSYDVFAEATNSWPAAAAEPQPEAGAEAEPMLEPSWDSFAEPTNGWPAADAEHQPVADAEPYAQPVADAEPYAQPVADAEPYAQPVADAEPYAQPVADAEPYAQPVADAEPAADGAAEPQPMEAGEEDQMPTMPPSGGLADGAKPMAVDSIEVALAEGGLAHEVTSAGAHLRIGTPAPAVTHDPTRGLQVRLDDGWCWCRTEAAGPTPTVLVPGAVVRPATATTVLVVVEPDGSCFLVVVEGEVEIDRPAGATVRSGGSLVDLAADGRFQADQASASEIAADPLVRTNRALDAR